MRDFLQYIEIFADRLFAQEFWQMFSIWFALPIVFCIEKIWPTRKVSWLAKGWLSDLFHTYEPWVRSTIYGAYIVLANNNLAYKPISDWVKEQHPVLQFLLLFVTTELIFYAAHRVAHANPVLWEFHKVHHSSSQYYSLMTKRFHV